MTPRLRLALHQALDLVLDAVEADVEEKPKRVRVTKAPSYAGREFPAEATEHALKVLEKNGYRRTA